jgi:hypothetical protein
MKNALRTVMLVSLFVPMATMAQVDCNFVTLDEKGNGTYILDGPGLTINFTGSITTDPSGGARGGRALVYTLPFTFTQTGDYLLTESDAEDTNITSDVVRFWGNNQVIFYSSNSDVDDPVSPPDDLADVSGLPVNSLTPSVVMQHPQPGLWPPEWSDWEGIQHEQLGDPGYAELNLVYAFESVPEPSTLALAGVGLAGVALMAYRRRSK